MSKSKYSDPKWDELLGQYNSRTDRSVRPKRIGNKERDAHAEYVNEAYAAGYLNDEEAKERRNRILEARYNTDLNDITEDLPAYAELKGNEVLPKKVRKWGIGVLFNGHPVVSRFLMLVLGLAVAVVPGVELSSLHLNTVFPFSGFMALSIITGAGMCIAGLFGLINYAIENDHL
jgi:hypothetical protein